MYRIKAAALALLVSASAFPLLTPAATASSPRGDATTLLYVELRLQPEETWQMDCVLPNGFGPDLALFEYSRSEYRGDFGHGYSEGYGWGSMGHPWTVKGQLAGERVEVPLFESGPGSSDRFEFSYGGSSSGVETVVMASAYWDAEVECDLSTDLQGEVPVFELDGSRAQRVGLEGFESPVSLASPIVSAGVGSRRTSIHEGTVAVVFGFGYGPGSSYLSVVRPNGRVNSDLSTVALSEIHGDGEWTFTLDGFAEFPPSTPLFTMDLPPSPFTANSPWNS